MAILRCKMCGGELDIVEGASIARCEFCGSVQTIPKADDEKKLTLFSRANRLRLASEFDKAAGVYEAIVADFPEEAEAYWGLVLCRYGIEYVDDPATGKKIPTCHRSSFVSVFEDEDLDQALENADAAARRVYREEAKQIEEIRKGIIAVSSNEEPYDIFICYKETAENGDRTLDSVLAQDVYDALQDKGYRVFFSRISLEDKLGLEYEPYIFAALNSARIMLAFGTDYEYYNAVWVKNEWSRFLKLMAKDKTKHLIPCYKGIDAYDMPKEFQRLQAQDLGKVGAIQDLLRGIAKIMPRQESAAAAVQKQTVNISAMVMRGQFALDDGDWLKADEYFERALDENPEDAHAYVGKVLVGLRLSSLEQLKDTFVKLEGDKNFERAIRFAADADKAELVKIKELADRKWYIKCLTVGLANVARSKKTQATMEEIRASIAQGTVEGYKNAAELCKKARSSRIGPEFTRRLEKQYELQADILRVLCFDYEERTIEHIKAYLGLSGVVVAVSHLVECIDLMLKDGTIERGITAGTVCRMGANAKRAQLRNEKEYSRALGMMSSANAYDAFFRAADVFDSLGSYLDSADKAAACRASGRRMQAEMEARQRENAARLAAEQEARMRIEAQRMAQQMQWRNTGKCQYCGGDLKGFFSKKCVNCGRAKNY